VRLDVFITYFSNWSYLQSVKIKEGINNSNLPAKERVSNFKYGIRNIKITVQSPNMNALTERFVDSVHREALDY
jgi:hypothetical protein